MGRKKKKSKTNPNVPCTEIVEQTTLSQTKELVEEGPAFQVNHVMSQQEQCSENKRNTKNTTKVDTEQKKKSGFPLNLPQNIPWEELCSENGGYKKESTEDNTEQRKKPELPLIQNIIPSEIPQSLTSTVQQPKRNEKARKVITTKTFTKGLMDVSLLTSNATQLRSVMLDPEHPFSTIVCTLIVISISLQVTSTLIMLMSDYYKTHTTKDEDNSEKRKRLNFISMAAISLVTVTNVLISAFHVPGDLRRANVKNVS